MSTNTSSFISSSLASISDVGQKRANNEDYKGEHLPTEHHPGQINGMLVVSDGMGGHAAGDIASKVIVKKWTQYIARECQNPVQDNMVFKLADYGMQYIHTSIQSYALKNGKAGMGATIVTALLHNDNLHIFNVGDSPALLMRDKQMHILYHSDNEIERLLLKGEISPEMASQSAFKSHLDQAVGVKEINLHHTQFPIYDEDRLLLCSDGLTTHVNFNEIASILREDLDNTSAAKRLVDLANLRGGNDNITVVLASIQGQTNPDFEPLPEFFRTTTHPPQLQTRNNRKRLKKEKRNPTSLWGNLILGASILALGMGVGLVSVPILFGQNKDLATESSPSPETTPNQPSPATSEPETGETQTSKSDTAEPKAFIGYRGPTVHLSLDWISAKNGYEITTNPEQFRDELNFEAGKKEITKADEYIWKPEQGKKNQPVILNIKRTESGWLIRPQPFRHLFLNKIQLTATEDKQYQIPYPEEPKTMRLGFFLDDQGLEEYTFAINNLEVLKPLELKP